MHRHFGHRLRILHWCTDQAVTNALAELERIRQEKQTTIDETQVRLFGGGA